MLRGERKVVGAELEQVGWGAHGCGAQECVMVILLTCGNALGVHETLTRALGQPKLSDLTAT